MTETKPEMKMPELLVFAKSLIIGLVGAEVWRIAFYLGENLAPTLSEIALWVRTSVVLIGALLCLSYVIQRSAHLVAARICRSLRVDLFFAFALGIWANLLVSPMLAKVHTAIKSVDPDWGAVVLLLLFLLLGSPLFQKYWPKRKKAPSQLYFIADEEIADDKEDLLEGETQAKSFAQTVLASGAHPGLVFGVDGPWGTGKTSFINLAQRYWASAADKVIVCRFEPLRYASEPDLADRLIRDLSAAIQSKVFAPEFRTAATRYSRLIKGKADISFLGFKISLEPSNETVDDLLDDIDAVLRRIERRVIIVIDDLDRLDAKAINNVLFATRRTLKLSQATYVLCYDTEILTNSMEEGVRAREFIEKFVTVKLSLFVDSSSIRDFLRRDWQRAENQLGSIPSDTMVKLGSVLNELAEILDGELAASYLPLLGDFRKVKRFVNAMLLMQIEKSDLGRTDFNKRDLINLMLLHLNNPGLFRQIYAEETENRSGTFSVHREFAKSEFENAPGFAALVDKYPGSAGFLLKQLFDVSTLEINDESATDEAVLSSRACFNQEKFRNLESYLKLIVRFATPEPQDTFVLYQEAVELSRTGKPITEILESTDFRLSRGEHAHDQFWRVFVSQSHDLTSPVAEDAINTLIDYLPRYSSTSADDRGLRQVSIYSLIRLLDRAGWGRTLGRRYANTPEHVVEIAWRIFGERAYEGKGILKRLVAVDRGVLGWNDLMLFRLQCSADRQGQLYNLHSALIVHQDPKAETSGLVSKLAVSGMRKLSQEVFALFKRSYIEPQRNFLAEVNNTSAESFLGNASSQMGLLAEQNLQQEQSDQQLSQQVSAAYSIVKSFVIYQLSNSLPPTGLGVGCGYYDEDGTNDSNGIAKQMNAYMFGLCFNPEILEDNILHFLDYCLSHLSNAFFSGGDTEGYVATKADLPGGLDPVEMGRYWEQYGERIRQAASLLAERKVLTGSYIASYGEDLPKVFDVLDELTKDANTGKAKIVKAK